jgi:hypothetical protein
MTREEPAQPPQRLKTSNPIFSENQAFLVGLAGLVAISLDTYPQAGRIALAAAVVMYMNANGFI